MRRAAACLTTAYGLQERTPPFLNLTDVRPFSSLPQPVNLFVSGALNSFIETLHTKTSMLS